MIETILLPIVPSVPGLIISECHITLERVPTSTASFQFRLTLVCEQMGFFFFLLLYRRKEKTEYHVQYFTMELMINVEGLAYLFNVYFIVCYSFLT